MLRFANPAFFMYASQRLLPSLAVLSVIITFVGLYLAFYVAPPDYQQGETIRIMFLHVPAAWLSMFFYALMMMSALGSLIWRHPLADMSQKAAAPIGACFTLICLISGSLWGKPMWGTYWVWDARLTSMLVLFLMYCGILALWNAFDEPLRAARPVSILTLVGGINLPIIKFSVDWWNTLHQPASVLRMDGPTIHATMLYPLLVMVVGLFLTGLTLHMLSMRIEILKQKLRSKQLRLANPLSLEIAQ